MSIVSNSAVDQIGSQAADIAMRAAADYLRQACRLDEFRSDDAKLDRLIAVLRIKCREALDGGFRDAREAIEAGMDQVANMTFVASFRLAGIAAAKEACEG